MKALLVLEDGFTLAGTSFTGDIDGGGEVIFNTGMTGYQEILTDPSYCGQMVCMTYPLIGNYGVNTGDMESSRVWASALLVKECCKIPSNWRCSRTLPEFLQVHRVPGIENLDTRALTRHVRLHGAMRGAVSTRTSHVADLVAQAQAIPPMQGQNLATKVSTPKPAAWTGHGLLPIVPDPNRTNKRHTWTGHGVRLVVYDFGVKWNILRMLSRQDFDILVVPPHFSAEAVAATGAQAVFLSNGPGDPAAMTQEIATVKTLAQQYPIAGICLGHQVLGHALGGTTHKLKFGHHGCNHPVKNLLTGHIEISSQNHGFCVDISAVPDVEVSHINLNDGTLEGFWHKKLPIVAVQHHPEAEPGPYDGQYFFHRFKTLVTQSL